MNKIKKTLIKLLLGKDITIRESVIHDKYRIVIFNSAASNMMERYENSVFDERFSGKFYGTGDKVIRNTRSYITQTRRSGNTTRQIDYTIQALFNGRIVHVVCHSKDSKGRNILLLNKIVDRLYSEHDLKWLKANNYIKIDRRNCVIWLTEKYFKDAESAMFGSDR